MARRLPVFYGWVIVGTLTTLLMASNGARLLFGVVLKPISEEFDWARSTLTGAVLVNTIFLSAMQPFTGWLTDRLGPKRVMVGGNVLIALILIPFSFATSLWQVYLLYGLFGGIAFTSSSPVSATALVNRWFVRRRGAALSLATVGTPVGQLVVVPVAAAILAATDWQTTYRLLALFLVALIPLAAWLLKDDPAEIGEVPDGHPGRSQAATAADAARIARLPPETPAWSLGEALRAPSFWLLAYGFLVCGFTMAFATTHFLAYADDMGMHSHVAASAISVTAGFSIIGTVLLGMLADRTERAPVLALTYALRGVAFALLYAFETGPLVFLYAVVLGVSWSATTPLTAAIAADVYGRRNLGVIFGTMFTTMNLGFGIGAYLDGLVFDAVGHYQPAIVVNGLAGFSAAAAIYLCHIRWTGRPQGATVEPSIPEPALGD